jgi:hypothetical protein
MVTVVQQPWRQTRFVWPWNSLRRTTLTLKSGVARSFGRKRSHNIRIVVRAVLANVSHVGLRVTQNDMLFRQHLKELEQVFSTFAGRFPVMIGRVPLSTFSGLS